MDPSITDHERRIQSLERSQSEIQINARESVKEIGEMKEKIGHVEIHRDYMVRRFDTIEKGMEDGFNHINSIVSRLAWLVVSGVLTALILWIVKGGLSA